MKLPFPPSGLLLVGACLLSACSNQSRQATAPPATSPAPKHEGDHVKVRFVVTPDGNVIDPEVISSTNPAANQAALDGVRNLKVPPRPLTSHHVRDITVTTTIIVTKGHAQPVKKGQLQPQR